MVYAGNGFDKNISTGETQAPSIDEGTHILLHEIVVELKKMNMQLYIMTNTHIKDTEIE